MKHILKLKMTTKGIIQNAHEYLSGRQFPTKPKNLSEALSTAKKLSTDNDGSILEEFKFADAPVDLSGRTLEESCIEIDTHFCRASFRNILIDISECHGNRQPEALNSSQQLIMMLYLIA